MCFKLIYSFIFYYGYIYIYNLYGFNAKMHYYFFNFLKEYFYFTLGEKKNFFFPPLFGMYIKFTNLKKKRKKKRARK